MKANVIQITSDNVAEKLEYLYKQSAMTMEGLRVEDIEQWLNHVNDNVGLTKPDIYQISGKVMNDFHGLTGSNAYQNDLAIVSIPLENMKGNPMMYRLMMGCHWFDDIVDNNRRREETAA